MGLQPLLRFTGLTPGENLQKRVDSIFNMSKYTINMKTKKIIYLCYIPINKQLETNHYINELIRDHISAEFWDLSNIFFPDIAFAQVAQAYEKKIHDYMEFEEMIRAQDIPRCIFVVLISPNAIAIKIHRILTKYKCYLVFFCRNGFPAFSEKGLLLRILNQHRRGKAIYAIKQRFLLGAVKIYKKMGLIKNYDLVFAAGAVGALRGREIPKVINVNHFDYDNYLGLKDNPNRIINNEYCVFLDDNIVFDTDYKALNIKTVEPVSYFKSLCEFFDHLEKKFNLKVIIAAHPKAEYQGNEFGNRLILKGKTNELVKDCLFAVAQYSTSFSYAILYKKPIIFIYTNEMEGLEYFKNIKGLSLLFKAKLYNIDSLLLDNKSNEIQIGHIDEPSYKDYKYKYLTSRASENDLSCNLFLQTIKKL